MLWGVSVNAQKHIYLKYTGSRKSIINAVTAANKVLNSPNFYTQIRALTRLDNTDSSAVQIANLLETATDTIEIVARFMPIANAKTTTASRIKVSTWNFSDELSIAVNTLIHETVHAIDWKDGKQTFTHSSNNNSDHKQDYTAPWQIGAIAERMITSQ